MRLLCCPAGFCRFGQRRSYIVWTDVRPGSWDGTFMDFAPHMKDEFWSIEINEIDNVALRL
jgi:hypothetical protein